MSEMIRMDEFEALRPRLFGIAYRMLGSAMEAEDIVQTAYLRAHDAGEMQSAKAYLTRVVTNLCLDQLKSARERREVYVGDWLPEPVLTPDDTAEARETLSMAFLLLLDHLSPPERAVFLLHEVFDYSHDEIGEVLGKSPVACRQLLRRARTHLGDPPAPTPDPHGHALLEQFIEALNSGDVAEVMAVMRSDVAVISDGGGKAVAARHPIEGAEPVTRLIQGLVRTGVKPTTRYTMPIINGAASVVVWDADQVVTVMIPEWRDGKLYRIYFMRNPDKLNLRTV